MLLTIPPRAPGRPRLIPSLALRAGDPVGGRARVLSVLRVDGACAHFSAIQDGTKVEVQVLLATDDTVPAVYLRFLAEARKAAALQRPDMQRVLQVGITPDGHPFVVRDAQTGGALATLLDKVGLLPVENAVDVALAVCDALEAAHAEGIVHGALDPAAIHLQWTADGPTKIKLVGLGTSRAIAMLPQEVRPLASRAPELDSDDEVDARADIWGVGVLLHTMLAGEVPVAQALPLLAGVPDELAEIVEACLARDPARRPPTVEALASKLAPFGTWKRVRPQPPPRTQVRVALEDRASRSVVDTGPYDAVVLERLVEVSAETPVEQVMRRPASGLRPSTAPVSLSLLPPVAEVAEVAAHVAAPPPARRPLAPLFFAAACIGMGTMIAALSTRVSPPPAAAVHAPSPPAEAVMPPPAIVAATATATATETPPATDTRPAPAVAAEPPAIVMNPSRGRQTPPTSPTTMLRPAPPASAVAPAARPAASPIQPELPRADDDDLRRFLDDRR
jgi:hypothetical protein